MRRNVGDGYRGCLQARVSRGADLYRRIAGWAFAPMIGADLAEEPERLAEAYELAEDRRGDGGAGWARADPA